MRRKVLLPISCMMHQPLEVGTPITVVSGVQNITVNKTDLQKRIEIAQEQAEVPNLHQYVPDLDL